MARWSVVRGDQEFAIDAVPASGQVAIDVTLAGRPFDVDVDTAQEIRIKLAAAIGIAHRPQATTGPEAGVERTAGCPGVVRPTLPCPAVPKLAVTPASIGTSGVTAHHARGAQ